MAHISSNEDGLTAISLGNHLQLFKPNPYSPKLIYTNQLASDDTDSNDPNFVQHLFGSNKTYFGAITGDKKLLVWNTVVGGEVPLVFLLPKRPTCLCFCNKEKAVLVGDKMGDVYRCQFGNDEESSSIPQLLLGHLSMVLDVVTSHDDSLVVSVDRDEKIRVSHYPNAYNILNYCFGHFQLVSTIAFTSSDRLVSGAGDATVRLWDFKDGREVGCCATDETDSSLKVVSKISYCDGTLAVMGEGCKTIVFYMCHGDILKCEGTHVMDKQPYDICFRSGKLLVLVNDLDNPLVSLQKMDGVYTLMDITISGIASDSALPSDVKVYTDLLKVDAMKRLSVEITPEASINNVVMADERTTEPTIPEVVSMEA